jgi:hypothetical protein
MKPALVFSLAVTAAIGIAVASGLASMAFSAPAEGAGDQAQFDAEGRFVPPANYRDWVFLSSGVDMSYSPAVTGEASDQHAFDNTFVPRAAYEAFKRDGKWPDKTVIMLEVRGGTAKGSINQRGVFQSGEPLGAEAHVKDEARFKGGWGFFDVGSGKPAKMIPYQAGCYSCHQDHAAADTTFVQFYPTLLPIATKLGTLSASYLAESKGEKH